MAEVHVHYDLNEKYTFTPELKKKLMIGMGVGLVLLILGVILAYAGIGFGHHEAHEAGKAAQEATKHAEGGHHGATPLTRLWANLWLNGVFFTYIAAMGVLFVAIQYVAYAGWSATIRRVAEAFGAFLPFTAPVLLITFFLGGHDLFHWTHHDLYEKGKATYDPIIAGKSGFFFFPLEAGSFPLFWLLRLVAFIGIWYVLYRVLIKNSVAEDYLTDKTDFSYHKRNITIGAIFVVFFGLSESVSAWDWVMSIDTHWYSTMFGWYVFASSWVSALAVLTLAVVFLKEKGYLKMVNENHLHDLGKFMFAFSIFWTYIWFAQYMLQAYSNIPEEIEYWVARHDGLEGVYSPMIVMNVIINFLFPFLFLMTRDAKRKEIFLKITAFGILMGHYLDFFVMVMPGTVKGNGGFFLMEIGTLMLFACAFVYVFATQLSKQGLIAKNHPMMEESLHHSI
ncbi:quinol:cytochrome C oxidoreductase [Raineya orbicola]|uniref:Quinol:cytochrome C oxidoreductase n=1 Tax=Raineya orbicola TaxID=2016530 RepID=A0A2N3IH73_9BACT|nr:quinol:cytochrome C oxidoreductase [Raineya orbicola]PKQ69665.1 hypothetical protein Rain11_1337 [Raineya orbicola]